MRLQPGPQREDCACGCGVYSVRRRNGHVRGCRCRSCIGGRNRSEGLRKQRQARRAAGVPDAKYGSKLTDEENWTGPFRVEVKSGAQVKACATAYLKAEAQSELARALGDPRPFVFIAMPERMGSEGLVVMRLSAWRSEIAPRLVE